MTAHQPGPDPSPLPLLLLGGPGLDAHLLAALRAAPVRTSQARRPLNPLDPGLLPGPSAPAPGA